jgi:hypothetical protein
MRLSLRSAATVSERRAINLSVLWSSQLVRVIRVVGIILLRHRQSQRAAGIREQPRPKADKDRSGLFAAQIYIEPHFAGRKSLM